MFPFSDNIPRVRPPVITYLLIMANVWMFMIGLRLPEVNREQLSLQHGFIPIRLQQLVHPRPITIAFEQDVTDRRGRRDVLRTNYTFNAEKKPIVLSLLTYMFLHGGWLHLIGNMWMLWIFGDNVEDRLGHAGYLVFYLLGGITAALGHWLNDPSSSIPVIGASGAIAAILGAYAVTWPWARVKTLVVIVIFVTIIELPALAVLGVWFVTQLIQAREAVTLGMNGGVAWWAHIVGFLVGALLMPVVRGSDPDVVEAEVVTP
jgi:membrane associated rhomboid family serine protease